MKVALAVWGDRISPLLDVSRTVLLVDIEKGKVAARREVSIQDIPPFHRASWLANAGVETLICGAISRPLSAMLEAHGIQSVPFTAGATRDVLNAFIRGALPDSS